MLLPSATARLSLSFSFILCGAAGGVKESTRVMFIPDLSLIVWIPRSVNSLKVVKQGECDVSVLLESAFKIHSSPTTHKTN